MVWPMCVSRVLLTSKWTARVADTYCFDLKVLESGGTGVSKYQVLREVMASTDAGGFELDVSFYRKI